QDDLATVRAGAPAYLIMVDSFLQGAPQDVDLLISGSKLYGAYGSAFVTDPARAARLSEKSLSYARSAFCNQRNDLCEIEKLRFPEFEQQLRKAKPADLAALYAWGAAWGGWIQVRRDDWNAIAEIPKIDAIMGRVVELDDGFDQGGAHLYLGVLNSLLPPTAGGKPELAKAHFERAIELSGNRNLMVKTLYAESYARLVFERELHDRLLSEVLASPVQAPGLTLVNTLAQEKARELLAGSADFF
ncbi:MAG: TRAP transporter TatT component family protein, partial [Pseudomonadota bacterium]|nr:TRAP transporter TatT component family protein [Pseudomonadota bacterium]